MVEYTHRVLKTPFSSPFYSQLAWQNSKLRLSEIFTTDKELVGLNLRLRHPKGGKKLKISKLGDFAG